MFAIFKRTAVEKVMQDQLYEARRHAVEHEASAEHHAALAKMYRERAQRLEAQLPPAQRNKA